MSITGIKLLVPEIKLLAAVITIIIGTAFAEYFDQHHYGTSIYVVGLIAGVIIANCMS